jgi:hypothetical protein
VNTELGLLTLAQNFKKWAKNLYLLSFYKDFLKNIAKFHKNIIKNNNKNITKKVAASNTFETATY